MRVEEYPTPSTQWIFYAYSGGMSGNLSLSPSDLAMLLATHAVTLKVETDKIHGKNRF
jgi:hypothetical protein